MNAWPKSAGQITRTWRDRCLKFKTWLCVVYPSKDSVKWVCCVLVCQVQEDTLLGLLQPLGDGLSFQTALQRRFVRLHPKLPPWNQCLLEDCLERKAKERSPVERQERVWKNIASQLVVMVTAPSNVFWLVEKPWKCHLKDCFIFHICPLLSQKRKNKACSHVSVYSQFKTQTYFPFWKLKSPAGKKIPSMWLPFPN